MRLCSSASSVLSPEFPCNGSVPTPPRRPTLLSAAVTAIKPAKVRPHKTVLLIKALPPVTGGDNFMAAVLGQSQTRKTYSISCDVILLIKKQKAGK